MAITFHPKAGMVLMCDFSGMIVPEINKKRPIVVISPNNLVRKGLCTIIPLSTTIPDPIEKYHYKLPQNPLKNESETWAKCDLVMSVSIDRLDRIKIGRGTYFVANVSMDQVREMRKLASYSFGAIIDNQVDSVNIVAFPAKAGL
jgi:uncharacterized protein YifN (PemK superfamily)